MRAYGLGEVGGGYDSHIEQYRPYILESFYYADKDTERLIPYFGDFLLDSGAFTFIQGNHGKKIIWDEYVEQYADFINRNDVKKFFELDIYSVIGIPETLRLRKKLEDLTGKQSIPVWHKLLGTEQFLRDCEEYPYIGLGGVVIREISPAEYKYFPWFIREAHKRNCKIHCLGFTNLEGIRKYHFDSVDSTAWTTGNRFGHIYQFDGRTMRKIKKGENQRLADAREVAFYNFSEWCKFQQYAERNL